jgi:anaerobic selenocysteine-containing dehydrogenase
MKLGMLEKSRTYEEFQVIVKTYCARMDHGGCGLLVHLEDGKITRIEGDPDSPLSHGYLCAKWLAQLERINHPDRLQYPMKRLGKKGEGQWTRISWEEALDTISEKVRETIAGDGRKAKLNSEIDPRVVLLSDGWWFPERKDLDLCGWKESNLNILTSSDPPYDPAVGSTHLRGVPCRIYKSQS